MHFLKKRLFQIIIAVVIIIAGFVYFTEDTADEAQVITYSVSRGEFKAEVYSTGQLQAENSVPIDVPSELSSRNIRIWEIKISKLIDEGTVVDSGDFVAMLDQSGVEELVTNEREELETKMRAYEDAKIDTNINLSNLRDGLINAKVDVEEKQLILNQSKYESPAVIRQANLDLERANRQLEQENRNYELKKKQDVFRVQRAYREVVRQQEQVDDIEDLLSKMEVRAPQSGMVIYDTDRFGNKIKVGSTVSTWRPTFATLPDLTSMISKTFINEIDISRINVGQEVRVGIDAFPDKVFKGTVRDVANIGQVLPGGDSKVFEVTIKLEGSDPELKPAMTTSNAITVGVMDSVLFIPLETVHQTDSLQYVFKKERGDWVKQIIDAGVSNENYIVVNKGVEEGDVLLLSMPENPDGIDYEGLDIYQEQLKRKEELEKEQKEKLEKEAKDTPSENNMRGERRGRKQPNNSNNQ